MLFTETDLICTSPCTVSDSCVSLYMHYEWFVVSEHVTMNQQLVGVVSCHSVPHCSSEIVKCLPLPPPPYLFNPLSGFLSPACSHLWVSDDLTSRLCFCFVSIFFPSQLKVLIETWSNPVQSWYNQIFSFLYRISDLLLSILVCFDRALLRGESIHLYLNMMRLWVVCWNSSETYVSWVVL